MAVIKTILVFVLLGPPIGLQVFLFGMIAIEPWPSPPVQAVGNLVFLMIVGIPFSYIIGIVPALAVGVLTAAGDNILRRFGFVHVALLGLVCGLVYALTVDRNGGTGLGYAVVKVMTCLLPTIVCWMISRRWNLRLSEQSDEAIS